jgi:hypothetical protein
LNRRFYLSLVAAAAICGGSVFFASSQPAAADDGLIGGIVNGIHPGLGTAMDAWSREWQKRDSDHSVLSQTLGAHIPDEPFRPAPGAGPASAGGGMGNKCAFPTGGFAYIQPAPVGTPCSFSSPMGVMSGNVAM